MHRTNALPVLLIVILAAACATTSESRTTSGPSVTVAATPSGDPRVGLDPGYMDAAAAVWNMRLVSNTPPPEGYYDEEGAPYSNSDLAFKGNYVIQGNYHGPLIWDISDPSDPSLVVGIECPASQNDVSVYGDLLFVSVEAPGGRIDCGGQGVEDSVSTERMRGVRIYDIADIAHPRLVTNVQTCRGSHTHTVVPDPDDSSQVYIYVSGRAPVRSSSELPGCSELQPSEDPNSVLFNIEIIDVPLDAPQDAKVIGRAPILSGLAPAERHPEVPADSIAAEERRRANAAERAAAGQPSPPPTPTPGPPTGPVQCHDITVYPAIGRAGGACGGYGLLLDITDPAHPKRIAEVADPNFAFWHSATFNNDGTKILFADEWGGGSQPRCRATDKPEWGANAIYTIAGDQMTYESYYKLPAPQTSVENCVAHNGSLIPVPGRDIMVQGWYQGGISVFDWTDPENPKEIAFFDRGPRDPDEVRSAGSWSAYWYNGYIVSSEIARGLDILELTPSEHLSQEEINAAKQVRFEELNVQTQPKLEWPASPAIGN
ncbi:MAG: LVIVD repeat-containing protein [Gemmatimonadota bacterium]